jgi:hypothetical protein
MMKSKMMASGGMTKKGYAAGGMPMVKKDGMNVPAFAADGKGKMAKGGDVKTMAKKGYAVGGILPLPEGGGRQPVTAKTATTDPFRAKIKKAQEQVKTLPNKQVNVLPKPRTMPSGPVVNVQPKRMAKGGAVKAPMTKKK